MNKLAFGFAAFALSTTTLAQDAAPSPNDIVAAATPDEWIRIPAEDLLIMELAPDTAGNPRRVVIQLMPAPFSQGWIHNIRLFARSGWYDGTSVNRVQDNYVTQWGDPNYDNPEATGTPKSLPRGLKVMDEGEYAPLFANFEIVEETPLKAFRMTSVDGQSKLVGRGPISLPDAYAPVTLVIDGWPVALERDHPAGPGRIRVWPVHCYGMVGVGRNYSPDTGSGAELYTVIGHAPRQLDRNIALVGRVIEGMEHLSSLPRGKGELGFYADFETDKRTPILRVRLASDLPAIQRPSLEYLSSESQSFARYVDARANHRDAFFIHPADGADICNVPVPVRRTPGE